VSPRAARPRGRHVPRAARPRGRRVPEGGVSPSAASRGRHVPEGGVTADVRTPTSRLVRMRRTYMT
jgi:hypothetical protein